MTEPKLPKLPSGGGSYIVTPKGELERVEGTIGPTDPAHPDQAIADQAAATTADAEKPVKKTGSKEA
jgi:hypothetical protein